MVPRIVLLVSLTLALGLILNGPLGPNLAAQNPPPDQPGGTPDWVQIRQRLESVEAELGQVRAENRELKRLVDAGVPGDPVFGPSFTSDSELSPHTAIVPSAYVDACDPLPCDAYHGCPDCGKPVDRGQPHLCGVDLSSLLWKKSNGWKVVPFGRLRGDLIYSKAAYVNDTVIVFLNPRSPGVDEDAAAVSAKQSAINFALTGPTFHGWETGGLVLINFMGPQPLRNFSGANIVNAYGEIKNDRWRFAAGRMFDQFGPLNPTTVNQIQQRGAGNIGIYRGAFHVDRFVTLSPSHRWTLSTRISQADITDYASVPFINGQNNGWPNVEARIGVGLGNPGETGRPMEMGVSGFVGELQAVLPALADGIIFPGAGDVIQSNGVCLDTKLGGDHVGVRCEAWYSQAAGTYFASTLQSINPETNEAIRSVGGWGELYCKLTPKLTTHVGYAVDDPRNGDLGFLDPDLGAGQITFNEAGWWNAIYDLNPSIQMGLELSHRRTQYLERSANNEGFQVHFASQLNF